MQLTQFSDYALRVLLYLSAHPDRVVAVQEIGDAYGISTHHLLKVVQALVKHGYLSSARGRGGGVCLKQPPARINIGAVVRATEPHLHLLECFDAETNTCPIDRVCGLKRVMLEAQRAFLAVLDQHTLASFAGRTPQLLRVWRRREFRQH